MTTPDELDRETAQETALLHALATAPERVLPAGKSLLALLVRPDVRRPPAPAAALHARVEDLVHRAFWDDALRSLEHPLPSVLVPRLKLLYTDLEAALRPLLPPAHPILQLLSAPLSPTSAPLLSTRTHLREILFALKSRCAPVRDPALDALIARIDQPAPASALPSLVVDVTRDILHLAQTIKDDLAQFVLGSMSDDQLRQAVRQQARVQTRAAVEHLWGPQRVAELWHAWLAPKAPAEESWIHRLLHTLAIPHPVSCPVPAAAAPAPAPDSAPEPTPDPAVLPPPFLFDVPALVHIQNRIQALVATAVLRALTRLPPPPAAPDFTSRVYALLDAAIADPAGTTLAHLADEVVRARAQAAPAPAPGDEAPLRAAVERTLRADDPVFALLLTRLVAALARRTVETSHAAAAARTRPVVVPANMRTGRAPGRLGLDLDLPPDPVVPVDVLGLPPLPAVRGFEDPVLVRGVAEVAEELWNSVAWVASVWPDLVAV